MKCCKICREELAHKDTLCSSCRETIDRLTVICKREPALLHPQTAQAAEVAGAETLAIGA